MIDKICELCGKPFRVAHNRPNARFCSYVCSNRGTAIPLAERFWSRVDKSGGADACWLWTGTKDGRGYGTLLAHGNRHARANRVVWELVNGPIPDGLDVLHNCPDGDNPACVNPAHLWLGTHTDNMRDMSRKGRQNFQRHPEKITKGEYGLAHMSREQRARGERHGCAKLTELQVLRIREQYAAGNVTQRQIASEYGVDRTTIGLIVRRQHWAHI
jgi:hypothetical protein